MADKRRQTNRPAAQQTNTGTKKKGKNEYTQAMAIDLIVLVSALLIWALYNHVIPHTWELRTAYTAVSDETGVTSQLTLDKETHTYVLLTDSQVRSDGSYKLSGRTLRLTDGDTGDSDSYAIDGDVLVSVDDVYDGEATQASKFDKTFTHTADGVTITIACSKDKTYTKTISDSGTETVSQGTYERDGDHLILTQVEDDGSTQTLQGLYIHNSQVTSVFYIADETEN